MTAANQIYKGAYFTHSRWLDPDHSNQPMRCKVTRVARGLVYYRPHYGWHDDGTEWLGNPWKFGIEDADKYFSRQSSPYARSAAEVSKTHKTILRHKDA